MYTDATVQPLWHDDDDNNKKVETGQGGNVTLLWDQQVQLTEPFLTTNQTL
jgi:hypothetical protein